MAGVSGPFIPHGHTGPSRVDAINVCGMNERGLPTSPPSPLPMSSPTGRGEFPPGCPAGPSHPPSWDEMFQTPPATASLQASLGTPFSVSTEPGVPGCPSQTQLDNDSSGHRKLPQLFFGSAGLGLRFILISPPPSHVLPVGYHMAGEFHTHLLPFVPMASSGSPATKGLCPCSSAYQEATSCPDTPHLTCLTAGASRVV